MFEGIVITLREGVEAVLVLSIALAFLRRRGLERLTPALIAGTTAAIVASIGVAWLATRITWNEELAEGIAELIGAALVFSLVVWMWRAAPRIKHEIETALGRAAGTGAAPATEASPGGGSALGVMLFAFGMVLREGAETAIFLSAARFNSEGVALWLGAVIGLALAIGFGVLFVRGSLRVPLKPFFTVTSAVLTLLAIQLLIGGLHELSEAQVLPASRVEMAIVGPIVRSELLVFALTIAMVAAWLLLGARGARANADDAATGPEARLARAAARSEATRRRVSGVIGLAVVGLLISAFVRESKQPDRAPATPLTPSGGEVTLDAAPLADGRLHFYETPVTGGSVRFFAVKVGDQVQTCLDACEICGDKGYYEQGSSIVCRNCSAPIVRASLGRTGGCNPIPLAHRSLATGAIAIGEKDLEDALPKMKGR
jgi:high-affinity iron transporter